MKVAILAGGLGTRLQEETVSRPKPMVEIGGRPIRWHIMKMYEAAGLDDFVVALGDKGESIKRWFTDFAALTSKITVDLRAGTVDKHSRGPVERFRVALIDTGAETGTGGGGG